MRRLGRREVGLAVAIEEAVDDARAAPGGQVQRQAFAAEHLADLRQHGGAVGAGHVDAVDDDHAVELAFGRVRHHALRGRVDAGGGADDDGRGLDGLERGQRLADELERPGRVEQLDADAVVQAVDDGGVERMLDALLERIVVADGRAAFDAAGGLDGAGAQQQGLGEGGLPGGRGAHQCHVADRRNIGGFEDRHGACLHGPRRQSGTAATRTATRPDGRTSLRRRTRASAPRARRCRRTQTGSGSAEPAAGLATPSGERQRRGYWNATSAKPRSLRLCSLSTPEPRSSSSARMPMRRCCSTRSR